MIRLFLYTNKLPCRVRAFSNTEPSRDRLWTSWRNAAERVMGFYPHKVHQPWATWFLQSLSKCAQEPCHILGSKMTNQRERENRKERMERRGRGRAQQQAHHFKNSLTERGMSVAGVALQK